MLEALRSCFVDTRRTAIPRAWKVVDGKLYLNYNDKAKASWEREQETNIEQGDKNWVEFKAKKPQHKG